MGCGLVLTLYDFSLHPFQKGLAGLLVQQNLLKYKVDLALEEETTPERSVIASSVKRMNQASKIALILNLIAP